MEINDGASFLLRSILDVFCQSPDAARIVAAMRPDRDIIVLVTSATAAEAQAKVGDTLETAMSVSVVPLEEIYRRGTEDPAVVGMLDAVREIVADGSCAILAITSCGKRSRTRGVKPLSEGDAAPTGYVNAKGGDA